MERMSDIAHCVALDLPGIGDSETPPRANDKCTLAGYVHRVIDQLGLRDVTLVGHDAGGMIVYAYLHAFPDTVARAAILDVVIPGIDPWSDVIRNPQIWHFGFHAIPDLPERMVAGREAAYFDFFFDAIAASPSSISRDSRATYAAAYARPAALHTGFEWYRAFDQDARDNTASRGVAIKTPVLYVRGDRETGDIADYVRGLRDAGLADVHGAVLSGCGHFSPDEQPDHLAAALHRFRTAAAA